MVEKKHDLIVIGAGPAGYAASLRAAQLGMDVACVEKEARLGGTCLRVGCIPSKALLESSEKYAETRKTLAGHGVKISGAELDLETMMARKDGIVEQLTDGIAGLFKATGVTRYEGTASLAGGGRVRVGDETLSAPHILIATGSRAAGLPGVQMDGKIIGDSTTALSWPEVPRKLVVIGAGVIGLELGSVWSRLGAEVTVLEYLNRILPGTDSEIARVSQSLLKRQGLKFQLKCQVKSAAVQDGQAVIEIADGDPITADRVLVAVGRKPVTEGLDLAAAGVQTDERGFIQTDGLNQAAEGVWAVGDVIGGAMLAHKATDEAVSCVERLVGKAGHFDADLVPSVCYTAREGPEPQGDRPGAGRAHRGAAGGRPDCRGHRRHGLRGQRRGHRRGVPRASHPFGSAARSGFERLRQAAALSG